MVLRVRLNKKAILLAITRRNMSQNMLAAKAGITSGYISQIMCGDRSPSAETRQKLMEVLSPMTFDDIFTIEDCDNHASGGE
jgi:transcriptional regulator with XRE-family HTH domain